LVLFIGFISFGLFAQTTDAQIREASDTLNVPFDVLKLLVDSYAPSGTPTTGTIVPGNNFTQKLAWLQKSADSHNTYIIEVNANENIDPCTFFYQGTINITIVLRGDSANRTIRLRSHGTMFTIRENITFILEKNITLMGHSGNNGRIVNVNGGIFKMNEGATISGNPGGGVQVYIGSFEMIGGVITGNTAQYGGGVYVGDSRTFTMTGGTISGNTASQGGGVYLAGSYPGGTLNMRGGIITGNIAREYGGGVYVGSGKINKNGGTITGYNSDQNNGNVVKDDAGDVLARRGHAAFVRSERRKETTAGSNVNLKDDIAGGWDN